VKGVRPSANTGQNTVLQLFYRRLVYLLSLPVLAFFVFEGGGRPDLKRGKGVLKKNHWMQNGVEYLIEAFGFEHCTVRQAGLLFSAYHLTCKKCQAPGEAEAELAAMNAAGHINAIVTNDVDSFLFGGLTVMRTYVMCSTIQMCLHFNLIRWNIKKDKGQVKTYNADDITHDVSVEMTRDGAVLFGLLNGGDYDSVSISVLVSVLALTDTNPGLTRLRCTDGARSHQIWPRCNLVCGCQEQGSCRAHAFSYRMAQPPARDPTNGSSQLHWATKPSLCPECHRYIPRPRNPPHLP